MHAMHARRASLEANLCSCILKTRVPSSMACISGTGNPLGSSTAFTRTCGSLSGCPQGASLLYTTAPQADACVYSSVVDFELKSQFPHLGVCKYCFDCFVTRNTLLLLMLAQTVGRLWTVTETRGECLLERLQTLWYNRNGFPQAEGHRAARAVCSTERKDKGAFKPHDVFLACTTG